MHRRYPLLAVVVGVAVALGSSFEANEVRAASPRIAYVRTPHSEESSTVRGFEGGFLADRYREGLEILLGSLGDPESCERISDGFSSATDPCFDPQGLRLVFSGRRESTDPYRLWEYQEGRAPQLLFEAAADCIQPSFLPGGRLVFASDLAGEYEEHGDARSFSLYEWRPEEDRVVRLGFQPSSEFDPEVLPDGRILYSSWQHVGNRFWPQGQVSLLLVNSDGTGIFPLTGNHRPPWMKRAARWVAEDEILLITAPDASLAGGELRSTRLNDPFAEYREIPGLESVSVADFAPLGGGGLIVALRSEEEGDLGLHRLEGSRLERLVDDPAYDEFAPAVGVVRAIPDIRFSTVVEDTPYGYVLILDVHETDRSDQHPFERGEIEFVRVLEGLPNTSAQVPPEALHPRDAHPEAPQAGPHGITGFVPTRILGEVPPAADGSIYLKVPADRPLRLQLVDDEGFVRMDERAWFWVRPNERRVCIGCHENRELSPHNQAAQAAGRRPTDLTEPGGWERVSFLDDVQPILDESCGFVGCHSSPRPAAALDLAGVYPDGADGSGGEYLLSYLQLLKEQPHKPLAVGGRLVHPGDSRRSPLLWMLYGRPLARQYDPAPFDRPMATAHPGPMLPESQLRVFRRWVDLGAVYRVPAAAALEYGTTARASSTSEVRP